MTWKDFEKECVCYLKTKYRASKIKFKQQGGSDSTISDIKVYIKNREHFFIEVKKTKLSVVNSS